jgi:hypothetical protein
MQVLLAILAIAASVVLLGRIALRDPKRMRAQVGEPARTPLTARQRRLLAFGAALPGLALVFGGWASSAVMWLGGTVTLAWLWVLWLSRPRKSAAGDTVAETEAAEEAEA